MNETSLSALLSPLHLLLLGYGHVSQALVALLASRSAWLASELGVRPVICGIGTRSQGLHIHPQGVDVDLLARTEQPVNWFKSESSRVDDVEAFIRLGKDAGATLLL